MAEPSGENPTSRVVLEAGVVFEIARHLHDSFPSAAGGVLLGPGREECKDDEIRITESFRLPSNFIDGNKDSRGYQRSMVAKLQAVGADTSVGGWYLSSSIAAMFEQAIFDQMWSHYKENPDSVVIMHDVALSRAARSFSFRAFRLSPQFVTLKQANKFSTEDLRDAGLSYKDMLEELAVDIHNSHLVNLLTVFNTNAAPRPSTILRVPDQSLVDKTIEFTMESIDDFNYEQGNYNYYQRQLVREKQRIANWQARRKADNLPTDDWQAHFKLPEEPSRLENLLLSAQIRESCHQVEQLAAISGADLLASKCTLP